MRVLGCFESTHQSTGYGVMGRALFEGLSERGHTLCELANFGSYHYRPGWEYLPVTPPPGNAEEEKLYNQHPLHAFGAHKFESALLHFRPDVVISFTDPWMTAHVSDSPFRRFYRWAYQPTIDAAPLEVEWLSLMDNADVVLTYTDWALGVAKKGLPYGNFHGTVTPGANHDVFRPVNRAPLRQSCGLSDDSLVVGTVMRCQVRKLYSELLHAFSAYLREGPEELTRKTFLYLHVCWPDLGWDIPRLIRESGVGSHLLVTYHCKSCHATYGAPWRDCRAVCKQCGSPSLTFPSNADPIPTESLRDIYNLMDCYVQYACCEGLGIPQIEAAACGVPVFAVNYSGMEDVVKRLGAYPVEPVGFFRDLSTHRMMAVPDNKELVQKLVHFFRKPLPLRKTEGARMRERSLAFNWKNFVDGWEGALLGLPKADPWDTPKQTRAPLLKLPENLPACELLRLGYSRVACEPWKTYSYEGSLMLRDLNWQRSFLGEHWSASDMSTAAGRRPAQFTPETAMKAWLNMAQRHNAWEERR